MTKILITGGAGFIGSHLAEYYLKKSNHEIFILDNFNNYYSPSFKRNNVSQISKMDKYHRINLIDGDIRDKKLIDSLFYENNFSLIFHLAAMAGIRYSIDNPHLYYDVNIKGTLNLLDAVKNKNISSFIFASSSSVYGNCSITPFSEEMKVDNPISPYAATKKAGEELSSLFHNLYNINITCLRFFTVYGPRGRPDMAPYKFLSRICNNIPIDQYGDGKSKRDYTYIDDIVSGIALAAKKKYPFEIFNLGSGKTIQLNDFIELIESITNIKAKINFFSMQIGDMDKTYADISKAEKMLGYKPRYTLFEGIKKMYNWFIDNRI